MRRVGPALAEQRTQYGRLAAVAEEVITGIEVVKATVREAWERRRFQHAAGVFRDLLVRQGRIEALNVALLAFGILTALALLHGIVVLHAGRIELSGLIAFVGLMALFRNPSNKATRVFSQMRNGIAGARRILAMLTASTELDQNTGGHEAAMGGAIAFERVSFGYHRGQTVLADVDLRISAGETVALVGQTGSAKTTLTQLVNRTYDPGNGRIAIDGVDLRDWNLTSLRSQIATIEQDVFLFSLSVADNIAFARPGTGRRDLETAARGGRPRFHRSVHRRLRHHHRRARRDPVGRPAAAHRPGTRVSERPAHSYSGRLHQRQCARPTMPSPPRDTTAATATASWWAASSVTSAASAAPCSWCPPPSWPDR